MKRTYLITVVLLAAASFAAAQTYSPKTDVLGAHLNQGRGCAACHAPHSGAYGNGAAAKADPTSGNDILWGEDVESLYTQTLNFGGVNGAATAVETLPATMTDAKQAEVTGLLTCLSCHDGNLAQSAMMNKVVYETLPSTYGGYNAIPTLLGNDGTTAGNYLNDHPVGPSAAFKCGAPYNWDCTVTGNTSIVPGPNMTKFINNYGFFVQLGTAGETAPVVVCTTCHNQHLMNVVAVSNSTITSGTSNVIKGGVSGTTAGTYQTMFFLRGPYNPNNLSGNSTAQFCRQCHGGESNEANNGTATTTW
jgi:cytochrome c553